MVASRRISSVEAEDVIVPRCNFCQSESFIAFQGREGETCGTCGSMRRHRVALEVYRRKGLLTPAEEGKIIRVLHLAPEYLLRKEIQSVVGGGYISADPNPSAYGTAQCLRLSFPDAFDVFPADYFDYIVHNHVMEHIPGSFRELLISFASILKPWGYHIFSVPGPVMNANTEEGGEFLSNDEERLRRFGQADHVRQFGKDLPEVLAALPNGEFAWDNLSTKDRAAIGVAPRSNRFLVWRKHRSIAQVT